MIMRIAILLLAAFAIAAAVTLARAAAPLATPVTADNVEARLTLACQVGAVGFWIDERQEGLFGACPCIAHAMVERMPSAQLVDDVEDIRRLARMAVANAWGGADTDSLRAELGRQLAENAIFSQQSIAWASMRCAEELGPAWSPRAHPRR